MKKAISLLLALMCFASLLSACRSAGPGSAERPSENETSAPIDTEPSETTENTQPSSDATIALPGNDDIPITLGQTGKLRISYTGNRSGVRYITDPSQLPDYPELAVYDEAYFQDHALLLVTETVSSGSVNVEMQSVIVENGVATVTLDHKMPAGLGTADMTTWLLWVEVDAGLELTWNLANPALKPQSEQNELY